MVLPDKVVSRNIEIREPYWWKLADLYVLHVTSYDK